MAELGRLHYLMQSIHICPPHASRSRTELHHHPTRQIVAHECISILPPLYRHDGLYRPWRKHLPAPQFRVRLDQYIKCLLIPVSGLTTCRNMATSDEHVVAKAQTLRWTTAHIAITTKLCTFRQISYTGFVQAAYQFTVLNSRQSIPASFL